MAIDPAAIELEEGASKGRYRYRAKSGAEAVLTFSKAGGRLIILDHTETPEAMRGMGVGEALVARAAADARKAGRRILPLCPFAAAQFRRNPEWRDVLDAARPR